MQKSYQLIKVTAPNHWQAYHHIRRKVLWENRGKIGYDDKHADESLPDHYPLLLLLEGEPIGTTRLDNLKNGSGIVRLVAIADHFQKSGHGRQLSILVDGFASALGIKTLYINAAPAALGFYEKQGWKPYEWDPDELKDIAEDCVQMRKILTVSPMTHFPKFDSVIFDLDGTLWDTMEACSIAWNRVVKRNYIPFRTIQPDDIRAVTGLAHERCIRQVFQGLPETTLLLLIQETMAEDNKVIAERGGVLYPGVKEGLSLLKERYPLFIVSNCQSGYIETFIRWSGFSFFKDFECWGNTGLKKSENLRSVIQRNHLAAPLFIGDTEGDQTAAKSCVVPFIHVEYGFGKCAEKDLAVKSFEELVGKLLQTH